MSDTEDTSGSEDMSDEEPDWTKYTLATEDETLWDKILQETFLENKDKLRNLETKQRKTKFQKIFIGKVKEWLPIVTDFMENDDTKHAIWTTKEKLSIEDDISDDEEAVQMAVDRRKYKIFKVVDWAEVDTWFDDSDEEMDEAEEDQAEEDEDGQQEDEGAEASE